jgi:hypothetical protein
MLVLHAGNCTAAQCADMPPPAVSVVRLSAAHVEISATTEDIIERIAQSAGRVRSVHPFMLINHELDTHAALVHRVRDDPLGSCDAPASVRIDFGLIRGEVFIAREAEGEPCVRDALLGHETEHNQKLERALDAFLERRETVIVERLAALARHSARDHDAARRNYEAGLVALLGDLLAEFKGEEIEKETINNESNLALQNACEGKILELDEQSRRRG